MSAFVHVSRISLSPSPVTKGIKLIITQDTWVQKKVTEL